MSMHIAFRPNRKSEFMTSDKLCHIPVLCYDFVTVTTGAVGQTIQLKRFWKSFFNTRLNTTMNTLTCSLFIYLFISDLYFVIILRLLDLVPVVNSVLEVRSCASVQNAFLLPLPTPTSHAPRKLNSGNVLMNENTNVFTHNFNYPQK
jgi:hypothetical protein